MKTGRISKAEEKRIRELSIKFSPEQIATKLGRREETIREWLNANVAPKPKSVAEVTQAEIKNDLRKSLAWKNLASELSKPEMEFFEEEYTKLVKQFRDDILPSEEKQVFDYLKTDILMSRCLQRQKKSLTDIESMRDEIKNLRAQHDDVADMSKDDQDRVAALHSHITFLTNAQQTATQEWTRLNREKSDLAKALRMAREQRMQNAATGTRFVEIVKELQDLEKQERESRHMGIIKRGAEKEKKRLSSPYQYCNGEVDLPLLTVESWTEYKKQEGD